MDKKNIFRPNILPFVSHECSVAFCDPVNSVGLLRRGVVQEEKFSDSVYICKYGQIHDCSVSNCGLEESCAVSGICKEYIEEYADYNKHDSRTWYKEPENVKVFGKRKKYNEADVRVRIEQIVETILYSSNRQKINEEILANHSKKVKREKDTYISECCEKKIPVNLIKLMMIDSNNQTSNIHMLHILKKDPNVIARYVSIIIQIYKNAETYIEDKISPEAIALGVLYKMQQGMIVNGVVLIPLEKFLVDNLPLMNDLGKLKIDKKKYTIGERLIFTMFENAKKKGKTNQDLAVIEELLTEEKRYELGSMVHCKSNKW